MLIVYKQIPAPVILRSNATKDPEAVYPSMLPLGFWQKTPGGIAAFKC